MRDGLLMVRHSDFKEICSELGIDAEILLKKLYKYRSPIFLIKPTVKEKKVLGNNSNTELFADILNSIRMEQGHQFKELTPISKEWSTAISVSSSATKFCTKFDLSLKEGYATYIKLGISAMKVYRLNLFEYKEEEIYTQYSIKNSYEKSELRSVFDGFISLYLQKYKGSESYTAKVWADKYEIMPLIDWALSVGVKPTDYLNWSFKHLASFNQKPLIKNLLSDSYKTTYLSTLKDKWHGPSDKFKKIKTT